MCVCVCVCVTYKFELFLVIQKRLINIKSFKNYIFFYGLLILNFFFNTKLTHLTQKLKKKKKKILD